MRFSAASYALLSDSGLVERSAPGVAPVSFRIWSSGINSCDGGDIVFSERSAELLLEEQDARAREYSFDFDHRSVMPDVSPEAGAAAGWHRLEIRRDADGKPECWAVACRWAECAKLGLEAEVPTWRYFSPCFRTDKETSEIVSYINCALTNNPLTRGLPALASEAGRASDGVGTARLFELHRDEDETGVSGTGVVAEGVVFADGSVALRWKTETASTTIFDDVDQMLKVHGHDGKTRLVYLDEIRGASEAGPDDVVAIAPAVVGPSANPGSLALARARVRLARLRTRS